MSTVNDDTAFDPNNPFASLPRGAQLTSSAGVITPTASHHHVAAGSITSIVTTNLNSLGSPLLLITADGAITLTASASLLVTTTTLAANDQLLLEADMSSGSWVWREIVPVRVGWTPFAPALSSASGTFSGGTVTTSVSRKNGRALRIDLTIISATITGTPAWVGITIPGGFTAARTVYTVGNGRDNGTYKFVSVYVDGTTTLKFSVLAEGTGNWSASAGNADISCSVEIETTA